MIRVSLLMVVMIVIMGFAGESDRQAAEAVERMTAKERAAVINAGFGVVEVEYETTACSTAEAAAATAQGVAVVPVPVH